MKHLRSNTITKKVRVKHPKLSLVKDLYRGVVGYYWVANDTILLGASGAPNSKSLSKWLEEADSVAELIPKDGQQSISYEVRIPIPTFIETIRKSKKGDQVIAAVVTTAEWYKGQMVHPITLLPYTVCEWTEYETAKVNTYSIEGRITHGVFADKKEAFLYYEKILTKRHKQIIKETTKKNK